MLQHTNTELFERPKPARTELFKSQYPVRSTPWGEIQHATRYADGITFLSTAGHGGFHLSRKRLNAMSDTLRKTCADGAFFEEDCNWAAVAIAFPEAFEEKDISAAKDTLKNWHPAIYEAHYGVKLAPGESMVRDQETFDAENAGNYVVRTAWGDWEETTPEGYCKVLARRASDKAEGYWLIPNAEYQNRSNRSGFVIQPHHHPCVPAKGGSKSKQVA